MSAIDPKPHRASLAGVAPISLDDIARRAAELWSLEPQVPETRRAELLADLHDLEGEVDALMVRTSAGIDVHPAQVRRCARRYLWLRQQWGHHEVAA